VGDVNRVNKSECIVVGVVLCDGRMLIQQRVGDSAMEGLWELPGGRVEPDETHAMALVREIAEEAGLEVEVSGLLVALSHAYPDRRTTLYAYGCTLPGGRHAAKPVASDPSPRWVKPDEYRALPLPAANPPILAALDWWVAHALRVDSP
jgi:8-oxo-dGTP diphosphatase